MPFFYLIKRAYNSNQQFFKVNLTKKNTKVATLFFKDNAIFFFRFVKSFIYVFFYRNKSLQKTQIFFTKNFLIKSIPHKFFWQLHGFKTVLISTPKGLITTAEAQKQKEGGFIFCFFL